MRTQANLDAAIGQELEAVVKSTDGKRILCAFSENVFVIIAARYEYSDTPSVSGSGEYFNHDEYDEYDLLTVFGSDAVAAWKAEDEQRVEASRQEREKRDRAMFELLKQKFTPTGEGGGGDGK